MCLPYFYCLLDGYKMAEIKSLEHCTLKVPYEVLNKKFRAAQKNLDRELDQIQNVSRDAEIILSKNPVLPSVIEVNRLVESVVQRLQILKRKCEESFLDELNAGLVCKRKLHHLRIVAPPDSHISLEAWQASIDQWKRIRMDRIVIEHLLRRGYYETAECLARKSDIRSLTNLDTQPYKGLFSERRWKDLVLNFRNENYRIFQLSTQSLLSVTIQAGLSALKTPQCYSSNCKNLHCPVCQEDFNQIAKKLPYSHCVQSRLICR
ncbi:PREDICTED: macrophage erythroblast attacher isoform X2 [Rhagoletis zephyria]|uniref:macrophage erythroblast attacher isoform X2 n=1 Tax=Rhagoletis zephyria TaxID=28612 RepID=UPI0008115A9B|nr:PREDICTED: macrophage erythroblast attacher isoform X2 [Rhagoletis zephyria]